MLPCELRIASDEKITRTNFPLQTEAMIVNSAT